ncbi:hypothetical protein MASR2M54_18700 [Aliarcobacter cryaerophilus]
MTKEQSRTIWVLIISSSLILAITMGARQSLGLFVEPLHSSSSFDIVTISLALAIGQLTWGFVQPFFGAIADKKALLEFWFLSYFDVSWAYSYTLCKK